MSQLQLIIPESIHRRLVEAAAHDAVSVDQFVATALAEKRSALMTEDYVKDRKLRGDRALFIKALAKVPDVLPEPSDRLS